MTVTTANPTATLILTGTAILIEQLPNMVDAVMKIRRLLEADGVEVRLVNAQAAQAADEVLAIIADWEQRHPQT